MRLDQLPYGEGLRANWAQVEMTGGRIVNVWQMEDGTYDIMVFATMTNPTLLRKGLDPLMAQCLLFELWKGGTL